MKNVKKLVVTFCLMLVMVLAVPAFLPNVIGGISTVEAASKVKINKKKATIYVGKTTTLKVSGTKSTVI